MVVDVDEYYRKYGPMVLRRCWRLLHDEEMAVDAMHNVFANLLRSRDRMVPERPASLLLRVSTSVCLNVLRSERRRPEDSGDEQLRAIACAEEQEERSMTRFTLGSLVSGEAESTRVMAVMHFLDGLSLKEVGDEVGLSAAGVHRRLRDLKMRLDRPSDSGSTRTGGRTIKGLLAISTRYRVADQLARDVAGATRSSAGAPHPPVDDAPPPGHGIGGPPSDRPDAVAVSAILSSGR